MAKKLVIIFFSVLFFMLSQISLAALPPYEFNYQGKLYDAQGIPVHGVNKLFNFRIIKWDGNAGTPKTYIEVARWNNLSSYLEHGMFYLKVPLSANTFYAYGLDRQTDYQIEISVDGQILTPNARFESVPYSFASAATKEVVGLPAVGQSSYTGTFPYVTPLAGTRDPNKPNIINSIFNKLIVANSYTATIRAGQLWLGGAQTSRGAPGRAMIDHGQQWLGFNSGWNGHLYGGDWSQTVVGGDTVVIQGDLQAYNNTWGGPGSRNCELVSATAENILYWVYYKWSSYCRPGEYAVGFRENYGTYDLWCCPL